MPGLGRATTDKGSGVARDPHSCLGVVWKLSGKCLVLDRRFDRRMRVSGVCQEVVGKVSGVRNEKSKAVAVRPLTGSVRGVVQGRSWRAAGDHSGLGFEDRGHGAGCGAAVHTVVWKLSGSCLRSVWC